MIRSNDSSTSKSSQRLLGEFLQAAGLLNSEQLHEAIEYQCIYGGKLGTNLIELGFIDETHLAKALSKQLKRHYIKPELLMNVSSSVLNIIPQKTALEYQVVPYYKDGKKLFVALNQATSLSSMDELALKIGHSIIPLAIPEVRLMLALKKHYDMQLPPRYETIEVQIKRRRQAALKTTPKQQLQKKVSPTATTERLQPDPLSADVSSWPLLGEIPYPEEEQNNQNFDNLLQNKDVSNLSLFKKLANPSDREDLARVIIAHLKVDFPKCALLMVRKESAYGWLATVESGIQRFEHIVVSLQENSVFGLVATNRSYYLGPMLDSPGNHIILDFFSTKLPQNVLVIPLTVQDRLVSLIYVQGDLDILENQLAELLNIADKTEMSFKLLILKHKILKT